MMTGERTAVILLSAFYLIQAETLQLAPLTEVVVGANITLTCAVSEDKSFIFYWYKLRFGYKVEKIGNGPSTSQTFNDEHKTNRLNVSKKGDKLFLDIVNVTKEDEAMYFCQVGSSYQMEMINSTFLVVDGWNNKQKSLYVTQIPERESVWPGDRVTLQCLLRSRDEENIQQCPQKRSVFWFRAGTGGSHPGIISTYRNQSENDEERSCEYSLSRTIHSFDAGTYYCAVISCGLIQFGSGTQVESKEQVLWSVIIVLLALLVCSLIGNAVQICRSQRCKHVQEVIDSRKKEERLATNQQSNMCGEAEVLSYAAVNFRSKKGKEWESDYTDCIYSGVAEGNI